MTFNVELHNIIHGKGKPLSPNQDQTNSLRSRLPTPDHFSKMTVLEWYEWFKEHPEVLWSIGGRKKSMEKDLMTRCNKIVRKMLNNPQLTSFVTMDGHGRTLYAFIHWLVKYKDEFGERFQQILDNIEVVDFSQPAHDWHQLFFPNKVVSSKGNIFDKYTQVDKEKTMVYFNFCGIGTDRRPIHTILNNEPNLANIVLSFSKRSPKVDAIGRDGLSKQIVIDICDQKSTDTTSRGTFQTWIF